MSAMGKLIEQWSERKSEWLIRRSTMLGAERIASLTRLAQRIEDEQIPGDVVECGVYRGGSAAILARRATHSKLGRTVWLFDVFQGMPPETAADGPNAASWVGNLKSSPERVERLLCRTGAEMSRVRIVAGLFQDTFPKMRIAQIALLNIDSDWYDSVKLCLETFYDAVAPGGIVSIDDYALWPGCQKAVDEFIEKRGLRVEIHRVGEFVKKRGPRGEIHLVDKTAGWFRKV